MLLENVHGARDEGGFGTNRQRNGIERAVRGAVGRGLGFLSDLGGRRVLALGETVNLVVEHKNFQAHIAAEHVDRVISADGKRITIAGGNPNVKVRTNEFDTRGNRGGPAVNRVEAEGVHVIGETAGAADARDKDKFFARYT